VSGSGQPGLGVIVGDASGHGVGAALLMAETRAYLRALALTCAEVGPLLTLTNQRLAGDLVTGHFVTLLLLRLDPDTRVLVHASAGHCPGYVLDQHGQIKAMLASTGLPLGIDSAHEFPAGPALTLGPGDLVFLFTDGLVEAASPDGKLFGVERTLEIVREHRHQTPAGMGSEQGVIILWDGDSFDHVVTLRGGTGQIHGLSFSHDGRLLAGAAYFAPTIVWDLAALRRSLAVMDLDW
jgi:sigma-B regulation protein RsbU (phosphoserine phosphatase)